MRQLIVVHQGRLLCSLTFSMNILDSELVHLNQSSSVPTNVAVEDVEVIVDVEDVLSDITGML